MKITFFGTQPYDRESFDRANASFGFEFNYHRSHLNGNNALLAQGANKRAGGMGLISGRKAFQRPMKEGVALLNAIQDVYLDPEVTIA